MSLLSVDHPLWSGKLAADSDPTFAASRLEGNESRTVDAIKASMVRVNAAQSTGEIALDQQNGTVLLSDILIQVTTDRNGTSAREITAAFNRPGAGTDFSQRIYAPANRTAEIAIRGLNVVAAGPDGAQILSFTLTNEGAVDVDVAYILAGTREV